MGNLMTCSYCFFETLWQDRAYMFDKSNNQFSQEISSTLNQPKIMQLYIS